MTTPPATTDVICNFDVSWVGAANLTAPPTFLFKDLVSITYNYSFITYQFAINPLNGAYYAVGTNNKNVPLPAKDLTTASSDKLIRFYYLL